MSLGNLPGAKQSPRIVGGILAWYEGDTFDLQVSLDLTDQDGEPVAVQAGDTVTFVFKNKKQQTVKEFVYEEIQNNCVVLEFDAATSALFTKGEYTCDVYLDGEERTTLADMNPVLVE